MLTSIHQSWVAAPPLDGAWVLQVPIATPLPPPVLPLSLSHAAGYHL